MALYIIYVKEVMYYVYFLTFMLTRLCSNSSLSFQNNVIVLFQSVNEQYIINLFVWDKVCSFVVYKPSDNVEYSCQWLSVVYMYIDVSCASLQRVSASQTFSPLCYVTVLISQCVVILTSLFTSMFIIQQTI
jgi:hypothetical protein